MNTCPAHLSPQSAPSASWSAAVLATLLTALFVWTFSHSTAEVRWLGSAASVTAFPTA